MSSAFDLIDIENHCVVSHLVKRANRLTMTVMCRCAGHLNLHTSYLTKTMHYILIELAHATLLFPSAPQKKKRIHTENNAHILARHTKLLHSVIIIKIDLLEQFFLDAIFSLPINGDHGNRKFAIYLLMVEWMDIHVLRNFPRALQERGGEAKKKE